MAPVQTAEPVPLPATERIGCRVRPSSRSSGWTAEPDRTAPAAPEPALRPAAAARDWDSAVGIARQLRRLPKTPELRARVDTRIAWDYSFLFGFRDSPREPPVSIATRSLASDRSVAEQVVKQRIPCHFRAGRRRPPRDARIRSSWARSGYAVPRSEASEEATRAKRRWTGGGLSHAADPGPPHRFPRSFDAPRGQKSFLGTYLTYDISPFPKD